MVLPSFRAFFERWPPLFFPALDGLLLALVRPALWLLQTLPQGFEQTTYMGRMVANPKLSSDRYSHSLACPHFSPKAMSLGSLFQKFG
jgi:hypothetical protein